MRQASWQASKPSRIVHDQLKNAEYTTSTLATLLWLTQFARKQMRYSANMVCNTTRSKQVSDLVSQETSTKMESARSGACFTMSVVKNGGILPANNKRAGCKSGRDQNREKQRLKNNDTQIFGKRHARPEVMANANGNTPCSTRNAKRQSSRGKSRQ